MSGGKFLPFCDQWMIQYEGEMENGLFFTLTGKIYAVIKSISFDKLLFFHGKKCSKVFATDWPTIAYQIFDGCGSDLGVD